MEGLGAVLEQIWALSWWQVLIVAIIDDVFLFLKVWPLWVALFVLAVLAAADPGR